MTRLLRRLFYRSKAVRFLINTLSLCTGRTAPLGVYHLATYRDKSAFGPLQQHEALLLFALVKTIVPKTVVEFGFFDGHSAFNFLQALAPDARLFSCDISEDAARIADEDFPKDPRFRFLHKSQAEFCPADVENRLIDFVFIDASHDLALNCQTFERLYPVLTDDVTVCIHDTGLWHASCFDAFYREIASANKRYWLNDSEYAHENDERKFVNWISETYPEFQSVHAHSTRVLRHGMTIMQRQRRLATA